MLRDLLSIAALVSCATAAAAQPASTELPPEVQTALARPLSPGAVALLIPYSATPAMARRWIEALEDPRPDVRAVAARVAFTTRLAAAVPALAAALDKETNSAAAAEIVRALALIHRRSIRPI